MFSKKYKKGMADAAKAYEAFGKKQEDALKHILEEVREGKRNLEDALKDLDGNINNLYDYLQSKEKANLYTVYTPFDIKDLDSEEKLFLLGALLSLVKDNEPNENQQKFIRSIQKYLDIKELPFDVDPLAIENIENISSQKAIYQVVLEYLILQDGDSYDETSFQQEFLESFNLNSKTRATIANHVEIIYSATGAEGLAEKYGYEEEKECEEDTCKTSSQQVDHTQEAIELALTYVKGNSDWNQIAAETDDYIVIFSDFYSVDKSKVIVISKRSATVVHAFSGNYFCNGTVKEHSQICSYKNTLCVATVSKIVLYDIDDNSVSTLIDKYMIDKWEACFDLLHFNGKYVVMNARSSAKTFLLNCETKGIVEIPYLNDRAVIHNNSIFYAKAFTINKFDIANHKDEIIVSYENEMKLIDNFGIYDEKLYYMLRTNDSTSISQIAIYSIDCNSLTTPLHICNIQAYPISSTYHYIWCDNNRYYINGLVWVGEDSIHMYQNAPCFNIYKFDYKTNKICKVATNSGYCIKGGWSDRIKEWRCHNELIFFRKGLVYKACSGDYYTDFNTYVDLEKATMKRI